MSFEPGEIVLVRFPFTDLQAAKKRPALVVSPPEFSKRHGDVVVLALTSQAQDDDSLLLSSWAESGLPRRTWIKPLIGTISGSLVERRLGRLSETDRPCASAALRMLVAVEMSDSRPSA
jgi:mRNA interferase MazF